MRVETITLIDSGFDGSRDKTDKMLIIIRIG